MAVRSFNGTSDEITLALGSLGFAFGPGSVAAIVKRTGNTGYDIVMQVGIIDGARFWLGNQTSNTITLGLNTSVTNDGPSLVAADNWALIGATKATGTINPRYHRYLYDTLAWTHADSASTNGNSTAATTRATIGNTEAGDFWQGYVAVIGVWDVQINDAQFEGLTGNLAAWEALNPVGLWALNQTDVSTDVLDLTGNGADETAISGTSVVLGDDPPGFSFEGTSVAWLRA